ncbi:oxygen-insensitive NAD(P)H nitroreductase [Pontiella agarivorans]|uniref:Oxygen-insensitive NAD(P)H nitroreductase n=1 Tax=Pontiella agarivorans TaxID=3038953 RepID=A0ABU5MXG1_9BACT|nr:oxygen-insensitive NAD(P)H nitroreductase [Pontiella agarivorans]MDZ8118894.1 oxygen-insensitive NAD(P)H nitroreductase [Pontiella agarivorans]
MNLNEVAEWRYSTKEFDPDRKISDEQFEQIKALLRKSPSSVNSQPWHFIIADTPNGKRRVAKGTQGTFRFNEAKILDASHSIVFCVKNDLDDDYLNHLLEQEEKDGRFAEPSFKDMMHGARTTFADIHRNDLNDAGHWMEKQVYLNMGTVLLGAAALGIDAVPMEGIDAVALNEEFGLSEQGYTAVAIISLGYRKDSDFNAALPKSRLPETEIFTVLD